MTANLVLSPAERAAVFIMLLPDEEASRLLAELEPHELEKIGAIMCALGEVAPRSVADAIAGFVAEAEVEALPQRQRNEQFETVLTQAVGELKAEGLMQRIAPDAAPRSIEVARWLAPQVLLGLIEEEHPQIIAVLLLMLAPETSAQILSDLSPDTQPQVVERIAKLGQVSQEAVNMLDQMLSSRITKRFGPSALKLGGAREAANLINMADRQVSHLVMPAIEARDVALAEAIAAEMFTFEMLLELDPMGMGRLLRDVENTDLVTALKGVDEDQQAPFFAAMSSRAADGVRDEMELLQRVKREEVLAAQKRIVEIARKLRDDGEISLGDSDGEYI